MLNFNIRTVRPADLRQISRIDREVFPPDFGYTVDQVNALFTRDGAMPLVAVTEIGTAEEIIGYCCTVIRLNTRQIERIAVSPRFQRKGVATALLKAMQQKTPVSKRRFVIRTAVPETNLSAQLFLRQQGHIAVTTERNQFQSRIGEAPDIAAYIFEFKGTK